MPPSTFTISYSIYSITLNNFDRSMFPDDEKSVELSTRNTRIGDMTNTLHLIYNLHEKQLKTGKYGTGHNQKF